VTTAGKGRLFCKTLLPAGAAISGEKVGKWHRHVVQIRTEKRAKSVFLHVLFPTDAAVAKMPPCSVEQKGGDLVVKVGELSHTFSTGK
jgi:hypothetical protein